MDIVNYLSPFDELPLEVTLLKINKNFFGEELIQLTTKDKLYDHLVSPIDTMFMQVESDNHENINIFNGDVVIVERTKLKIDGPAVVQILNELKIKNISHDKEFKTVIEEQNITLQEGVDFKFFGTITYSLKSEEEYFLEMIAEELFKIS